MGPHAQEFRDRTNLVLIRKWQSRRHVYLSVMVRPYNETLVLMRVFRTELELTPARDEGLAQTMNTMHMRDWLDVHAIFDWISVTRL
jgi:hypothetical protein